MTHAQHTRGPWDVDGKFGFLDVVSSKGRIAMIDCDNDDIFGADIEANARLIAAAPDLLAALIAIRPFVADEVENRSAAGSDMTDYQNEAADALDIIDTAIAQAKGA